MKYPAIYRTRQGADYLYASKDSYYSYTLKDWGESTFTDINEHANDKNITAEYLANTYGEVKSKEHAEFIVKLCENAGIGVFLPIHDVNHFVIKEKLSFHNCKSVTTSELKKITIPLPPKCECADEWPKVGDDAILTNENDYGITHGTEAIGKKVKVMSLFKDGDLDMAVIKHDITNYCFRVGMLKKPKTPEQELRDDIIKTIHDDVYKGAYGKESFGVFAYALMSKYNITKKGEGDE